MDGRKDDEEGRKTRTEGRKEKGQCGRKGGKEGRKEGREKGNGCTARTSSVRNISTVKMEPEGSIFVQQERAQEEIAGEEGRKEGRTMESKRKEERKEGRHIQSIWCITFELFCTEF